MKNNPFTNEKAESWIQEAKYAIHAIADVMEIGLEEVYVIFPPLEDDDNRWLAKCNIVLRTTNDRIEAIVYWLEKPEPKAFRAAIKRNFAFEISSRIIPEAKFIHMAIAAYAIDNTHPLPSHFITQVMNDTQIRIENNNFKADFPLFEVVNDVLHKLKDYALPILEPWYKAVQKELKQNPPKKNKNP